jgi:hypothetical protein
VDIEIVTLKDDIKGLRVTMILRYIKGMRDPYGAARRRPTVKPVFTFITTLSEWHLWADPSFAFLMLGLKRKVFEGDFKTFDDVVQSPLARLTVKPEFRDHPVFLASKSKGGLIPGKPLAAHNLNPVLKKACESIGILTRATIYNFRREAASHFVRTVGVEKTREILAHAPGSLCYAVYDFGLQDADIAADRFGTKAPDRNELRNNMGPAMVGQIDDFSSQFEAYFKDVCRKSSRLEDLKETMKVLLGGRTYQKLIDDPTIEDEVKDNLTDCIRQKKNLVRQMKVQSRKKFKADTLKKLLRTQTQVDMTERRDRLAEGSKEVKKRKSEISIAAEGELERALANIAIDDDGDGVDDQDEEIESERQTAVCILV